MGSCCEKKREQLSRYNKLMIRLKELIIRENELISRYNDLFISLRWRYAYRYISIVRHGISMLWSVISVLCYTKKKDMVYYRMVCSYAML